MLGEAMEYAKVGLALGAGSTKGFAHIGVLQVLEENHIPIDLGRGLEHRRDRRRHLCGRDGPAPARTVRAAAQPARVSGRRPPAQRRPAARRPARGADRAADAPGGLCAHAHPVLQRRRGRRDGRGRRAAQRAGQPRGAREHVHPRHLHARGDRRAHVCGRRRDRAHPVPRAARGRSGRGHRRGRGVYRRLLRCERHERLRIHQPLH